MNSIDEALSCVARGHFNKTVMHQRVYINWVMPSNLSRISHLFLSVTAFTLGKLFDACRPRITTRFDTIFDLDRASKLVAMSFLHFMLTCFARDFPVMALSLRNSFLLHSRFIRRGYIQKNTSKCLAINA